MVSRVKVRSYKDNLKKAGYNMSGFEDTPVQAPKADSGAGGAVRMKHPKTGEIRLVPAKDVAAAEAARYMRVQ